MLLHGFMETWRSWELALPALERHHDVLALTLAGHAGGPPLAPGEADSVAVLTAVERAMDDAGFERAALAGNSLGGHLALRLAERDRAERVVAFAPAGGWAPGDDSSRALLDSQAELAARARAFAPQAAALLATSDGRRRVSEDLTVEYEHIPAELLDHLVAGIAACPAAEPLIEAARRDGWPLDPAKVTCPVRIAWGTEDRLLPWPSAAAALRASLPQADWIELEGVGHCPPLDVPQATAGLILGPLA